MKTSDKILLIFILLPTAYVVGNLTSESFNIKSTLDKMFNKSVVVSVVNQNQQTPINKVVQSASQTVSSVLSGNVTNTIKQLPQTLIKKIGESYTLGNMEYKVTSAVNNGAKFNYSKTTGKFISVKILVKNIGKVNSSVSKIIIKDKIDRQYQKSDFMAIGFLTEGKEYGYIGDQNGIAPGFSDVYTAVFEVAKDSTDLKLCHPSTTGIDIVCVQLGL